MKKFTLFVGLLSTLLIVGSVPALAQQTGSISGTVTSKDGDPLPGVTVEASSDVLPRPRIVFSGANGDFRLVQLPPGDYELSFLLEGLATVTQEMKVLLQQNAAVRVSMQPEALSEQVNVIGQLQTIDTTSAEIKSAVSSDDFDQLPIGQQYRDLIKLIPGVQYSEDTVRGPSAGGSGQDNVYLFDGVNVTLPLFGTLSSDSSANDIDQISIIKGGAKAIDFNRSGGFTINTISKSGTNLFHGAASFQIQTQGMSGDRDVDSAAVFSRDQDWSSLSIGGPIVPSNLTFYASYFRPTTTSDSRSNLYGAVPDAESVRDEFFGKLTWTPNDSILIHGSYRDSENDDQGSGVSGQAITGTASSGSDSQLEIGTVEASWVINDRSFVNFKATDFSNDFNSRPDNVLNLDIRGDGTVGLDLNNLDRMGLLFVPQPVAGQDAFNAFIQPLINRYGFVQNGVAFGGGIVGVATTFNDQFFSRESFQLGYDTLIGDHHELHFGYQNSSDGEDLSRTSNGWGSITVPGGRATLADGTPIFFEARFQQQSADDLSSQISPVITSEFESQSFEVNDTITYDQWTINVGVLVSNDKLYGQGLRENSSNLSGFELAPGNRYLMHEDDFGDMIQPRLGVARALDNGRSSVYASYARYHPAASSLPRAASWARNLRRTIRGFFDANGELLTDDEDNIIGIAGVRASSGKFFQPNLNPRAIDEYMIGYNRQFSNGWTGKAYARYRYGYNFWEDTNNNARSRFLAPEGFSQEDYIPELNDFRAEIGGSSYVIAELDNAFTKYYEVNLDAEWRGSKAYFKGSYVWSHYYGNFDQDNTTTNNDGNRFIGSSFISDGAGRQLWNFRYGNLRGDRRHQLKAYGYYNFDWNGSVGAYGIYQSGQPWEAWDVEVYRALTGSSSDTSRFAEPAGSRTTEAHYQVDLNYTQRFPFGDRYSFELRADVFNAFDNQTGYNIQNKRNSANFGSARTFFLPRRFQLAAKFTF